MNKVSDKRLIAWCEIDPEERFIWLSKIIQPFLKHKNSSALFCRETIYYVFEKVETLEKILNIIADSVSTTGISDSYVDTLEIRKMLFEEIRDHHNAKISLWAKTQIMYFQRKIRQHQELEESINRNSYGSFE